jgi:hypothetical protein
MGDQPVTRAEFDILHTAAKALLNQMVALTAKIGNINNNNRNYNDKNNQNRRCGPIRVRGRNNQIIEDSNFSKVEKTNFEEIMSNHWKKLQNLREHANSAKSIEKDQKALKAKLDEDEVKPEGDNLWQHGGLSANIEAPQVEKHKEVQGIPRESSQSPICKSRIIDPTSIITNQENPKELISSLYPLNPCSKSPSLTNSSSFSFNPLMFCDDKTKKSQSADTIDAYPISEINMEIVKPTLLNKQIPTKAFSSYDLQRFGEVKFQSLSHNTIGGIAQSVLLSFDSLRCYDPGGFLVALSSCFQNQTSPSNLQCLSEVKFKPFSSNHLIALPPKPPDVIGLSEELLAAAKQDQISTFAQSPTTGKFPFVSNSNICNTKLSLDVQEKSKHNGFNDIFASSFAFKPLADSGPSFYQGSGRNINPTTLSQQSLHGIEASVQSQRVDAVKVQTENKSTLHLKAEFSDSPPQKDNSTQSKEQSHDESMSMKMKGLSTEATSFLEHSVADPSSTVVGDRRNPSLVPIRKPEKMQMVYDLTSPQVTAVSAYVSVTNAMAETHIMEWGYNNDSDFIILQRPPPSSIHVFDPGPHLFLHNRSVSFTTVMEYDETMTKIAASYTGSMNWIKEVDYLTPDCFVYLVERLLLSTSCWNGFIHSTKSSFIKWLICQDENSFSNLSFMSDELGNAHDFIANILCEFVYDQNGTKTWIKKSNLDVKNYVSRCSLHLSSSSGKYLQLLRNLLGMRHIINQLPLEFCNVLQEGKKQLGECTMAPPWAAFEWWNFSDARLYTQTPKPPPKPPYQYLQRTKAIFQMNNFDDLTAVNLDDDSLVSDGSNGRLEIRNNSQLNGLNVHEACLVPVSCTQDVLDLMKIGQRNRVVGATALNERSSRSLGVLTVHVRGMGLASNSILNGCLYLVDLAGSERVEKPEAVSERPKECYICYDELSPPRQQWKHMRFKLEVMGKDEHEYDREDAELIEGGGPTSVYVFHECSLGMDSTQIENPQLPEENFVHEMVSTEIKAIYQLVVNSKDTSLLEDPPNNLLCASAEFLRSSWQLQSYFQELAGFIQKNGTLVKTSVKVPLDAYMMDFVFSESENGGVFYNKFGMDYHISVFGSIVKEPPLHIIHTAVEMAPIAKVGGLGDVVTSLSRAVQDLNHNEDIILPKYDCLNLSNVKDFQFHKSYFWNGTWVEPFCLFLFWLLIKMIVFTVYFEQWDPGGHVIMFIPARSYRLKQWDPGG